MSDTSTGEGSRHESRDLLAELRDYLLATMPSALTQAAESLEPVRDLASSDGRPAMREEGP